MSQAPNQVTGADAGGPHRFRVPRAARIAYFYR